MQSAPADPPALDRLASERRARLAAECKLKRREAVAATRIEDLRRQHDRLAGTVAQREGEIADLSSTCAALRADLAGVVGDRDAAQQAARSAADRLAHAVAAMPGAMALFDDTHRLVAATDAYLAFFDGIEDVRPGITIGTALALMQEEGLVQIDRGARDWASRVAARWNQAVPQDAEFTLWDGRRFAMQDRRLGADAILSRIVAADGGAGTGKRSQGAIRSGAPASLPAAFQAGATRHPPRPGLPGMRVGPLPVPDR